MSKRAEQKQQNRQNIIDAYIVLLGQKRVDDITVTEICEKACVARKTLYSHFSGKEDILDTVSQRVMFNGAINAFTLTLERHEATRQRLNDTFAQVSIPLTVYQGQKIEVVVQLIQNLTQRLSSYSTSFTALHQAAYRYFEDCKKNDDTIDNFDAGFIAGLTVNALVGIILSWVSDQQYPARQNIEALKQHIADCILKP
ncbi:MAG: TetR/AcrR family transcriptional regulator [Pseudomonadales bacterium]|nr:TetR/AcrR family transcriptional regulator [Pseudomonadales bacterium]